jgi:hypothetical protein
MSCEHGDQPWGSVNDGEFTRSASEISSHGILHKPNVSLHSFCTVAS